MKKIGIFSIILFLLVCLCSCSTVTRSFKLSGDIENVIDICIYYTEKNYTESDVHNLFDENNPIYKMSKEEKELFLNSIETLEYSKEVVYFPIPMDGGVDIGGYIFCINYKNGYDLLGINGLFSYNINPKGQERYKYDYANYSGERKWLDLVGEYIEVNFDE